MHTTQSVGTHTRLNPKNVSYAEAITLSAGTITDYQEKIMETGWDVLCNFLGD